MAGNDVDPAGAEDAEAAAPAWARLWAWCVRRQGRLTVLGALVVIAAAGVGWVQVPELYVGVRDEAARVQAIVTTRASVLAALAGVGALVTIWINYRNSQTSTRTLATTQETFRVTERGHLTERYTRAIEQLGNEDSMAVRLGGIYALEQLAVDSPRDGDQATVVEVLSAFVRLKRPVHTFASDTRSALCGTRPAIDVQAALTVLGRLPGRPGAARAALGDVDLTNVDLTNVDLTNVDLTNVDLNGARLAGAHLFNTDLTDVEFRDADLRGADLNSAELTDTVLTGADLTGADLSHTRFALTDLTRADLTDANLNGADLTSLDLTETVGLSEAQLAQAWKPPAKLPSALKLYSEDADGPSPHLYRP